MLKVTINSGDAPERSIYVNDLLDVKVVQDAVLDEYQKVLAQDVEDERIEIERLLDASPCDSISELQEWVESICEICDGDTDELDNIKEMKRELDDSDYSNMDEVWDRINTLEETIDSIYWAVSDVR